MSFNPFRITITMFGTTPLFEVTTLEAVLSAFESISDTVPEFWSQDERVKLPYDRIEILQVALQPDMMHRDVYLRRDSGVQYFAILRKSSRAPSLDIEFSADLEPEKWPEVFALADAIAAAFKPDLGALHIWPPVKRKPWASEEDKALDIIVHCAYPLVSSYYDEGPGGLAMRTYLGPHFVEQFGKAFLFQTSGAVITELDWQGVRIDLGPEPWTLTVQELITHWQQAMAYLSPAGVFAEIEITPKERISLKKGVRCTIGGIIQ